MICYRNCVVICLKGAAQFVVACKLVTDWPPWTCASSTSHFIEWKTLCLASYERIVLGFHRASWETVLWLVLIIIRPWSQRWMLKLLTWPWFSSSRWGRSPVQTFIISSSSSCTSCSPISQRSLSLHLKASDKNLDWPSKVSPQLCVSFSPALF